MAKSFLERLARNLGRATGKMADKAREAGLDKTAGELIAKAKDRIDTLVHEYEEGAEEQRRRDPESAGEGGEAGDSSSPEERESAVDEVDGSETPAAPPDEPLDR